MVIKYFKFKSIFIIFLISFFSLFIFSFNHTNIPDDLLDISFVPDSLVFDSLDDFGGFFYLENYGKTPTNVFLSFYLHDSEKNIILNYSENYLVSTHLEFYGNFSKFKNLNLEDGIYEFNFISQFTNYYEDYNYVFLVRKNRIYDLTISNYITWTKFVIFCFLLVFVFLSIRIYNIRKLYFSNL